MKIPYKIEQIKVALENVEKVYPTSANRRRHEVTSHISKDTKYICEKCKKEYTSRDSLTRHIKTSCS